ncbi:MAG: hypothetical protein VKQ33_15720 [Candidatus Sericytochromatia bacterium]|nr:hypothetical protein [Candidatus Sericytochromatia bacterium]
MAHFSRSVLGFASVAVLAASFGCDASTFNTLNQNLAQVKKASAFSVDVRLPTAAIATALGGLELMRALSAPAKPASNNLVAAGGLNFRLLDLSPGIGKVEKINANNVEAEVKYDSKQLESGAVESTIDYFRGQTNGYDLDAKGSFTYTPTGRRAGSVLGNVAATMTGSIKHKDLDFTIRTLTFATQDPMPADAPQIGTLELYVRLDRDETVLKAGIGIVDSKIEAEAKVIVNGKEQPELIKFNQDNTNLAGAVRASN